MSVWVFSQPQISELSISALRDGREVVVSAWIHNPTDGPAFRINDLLAETDPTRDVLRALRGALDTAPAEVQSAMWGITLPSVEGYPPAGFTIALMLGAAPRSGNAEVTEPLDPDAAAWEGAEVVDFSLDGHPGQRRARRTASPPLATGATVPLLSLVYVAGTSHGVLTVAFGTPHVDFADIFSALFDRIARSVRIVCAEAPTT